MMAQNEQTTDGEGGGGGREREGKRRVSEGKGRGHPPIFFSLEPPQYGCECLLLYGTQQLRGVCSMLCYRWHWGGGKRVCRIYGTYCSTRAGVDISVVVRGRRVIATGRTDADVFCQRPPEPDRPTARRAHHCCPTDIEHTACTHTHTHTVSDQPCGRCGKCHGTQASGEASGSGEIFFSPSLVK